MQSGSIEMHPSKSALTRPVAITRPRTPLVYLVRPDGGIQNRALAS